MASIGRVSVSDGGSRMRCSAQRCTADPGPFHTQYLERSRVSSAALHAALRPGQSKSADHQRGVLAFTLAEPARLHPIIGAVEQRHVVVIHMLVADERLEQLV